MLPAKPCLRRGLLLLGACALVAGAPRAQSPLIVVDAAGGPGTDFTSIAAAVDAAPPGAVLLVRAGDYGPFEIVSKTLVVTADVGAVVKVAGGEEDQLSPAIVVRELDAGDVVVLEGLQAAGTLGFFLSPGTQALIVDGCAGQVWVQDCQLAGGYGNNFAAPALEVSDSLNVLVTGTAMLGGSYLDDGHLLLNGAGLLAGDSRVHLWDSQATGGGGGEGVEIHGGFLFAARSVFKGGQGFGLSGSGFGCEIQVNGGTGLLLGSGSPTAVVFDTQLVPGPADPGGCSFQGAPFAVQSGTLQALDGPAPGFLATSPTPDGAPLTFSFVDAAPGDAGVVLVASSLGTVPYFAKYSGALAVGSPWFFLVGPISASGTLDVTVNLGDALPPGTGASFYAQGAVLKSGGGAVLSAPVALTQFDT